MTIPSIKFQSNIHQDVGMEIVDLSDIYERISNAPLNFAAKPHRIHFHNLLYITQGSGEHFVDFNTYPIQSGSMVFIRSNQVHAFDLLNQPQGKLIIFTDEFLDTIFATMKTPLFTPYHFLTSRTPIFSLTHKIRLTCDVLLTEIDSEYQSTAPDMSFLHLIFSALLTKVTGSQQKPYGQHLSQSHTKVFSQFMLILEKNYTQLRDAKSYAKMLHITYKSLNQICKLATHQTAKQLIDAHIILEAKRRLSITNIRIQQLTEELGFDEATNFVKYFKKHTLLTPNQFKKSMFG
jgi:AraC-like DNA-binding protein